MKNLTIAVAGCMLLIGSSTVAQNDIPFDKEHFPDQAALKLALTDLKDGDRLYEMGGMNYAYALPLYERANAFNPNNAELNLKIGLCHLNGKYRYKALPSFQKVYAIAPNMRRIHYLLGYAHQLNAQWDEAIAEFSLHLKSNGGTPDEISIYNDGVRHIAECKNGKELQATPAAVKVERLSDHINTDDAEYGVLVTADGKNLMFTSRRSTTTGGKRDRRTNEYFEDIYMCERGENDWGEPKPVSPPINSATNDATIGLFDEGKHLLIYRDHKGSGAIFESKQVGKVWSEPKLLGPNINSQYHESSAWLTGDGKYLYFVSDRPEGSKGGQDIFRSAWDDAKSDWGPAMNLGATVNTKYDEDGVFIHPDGKTLYFSSRGHNCMGGYDIFVSTLVDGEWSTPKNLGWPVNSPDDDLFFVTTAKGTEGYFSSIRPDSKGEDDIYRVIFRPEDKAMR